MSFVTKHVFKSNHHSCQSSSFARANFSVYFISTLQGFSLIYFKKSIELFFLTNVVEVIFCKLTTSNFTCFDVSFNLLKRTVSFQLFISFLLSVDEASFLESTSR